MRALIACEYSGITREEFKKLGWDAWSCDILPTEINGNHFQGNVFEILNQDWDLLIAHPPCTYISSAGLHYCNIERHGRKAIERIYKRSEAVKFFLELYSSNIKHICVENPVGYISANILKPTQIVHPYFFGERELKRTALWLKNLPPLVYDLEDNLFSKKTATEYPEPYQIQLNKKKGKMIKRYFTDCIGLDGKLKTAHEKSKSFQSISKAMAEQWTKYILENNL